MKNVITFTTRRVKTMRGNLLKKLCAATLLLSLFTMTPAISKAAPAPTPAAAAATAPQREDEGKGRGRERHPHIRAAIRELQAAKHELQTADHDFGGHRDEAVEACDKALHQLQQALQFDKK
ncbi:MAG TPA: hypothetical protein VI685_00455 [Candidatus Angelobacter sp.]